MIEATLESLDPATQVVAALVLHHVASVMSMDVENANMNQFPEGL